jgi:hypothetical protein
LWLELSVFLFLLLQSPSSTLIVLLWKRTIEVVAVLVFALVVAENDWWSPQG